jgi:hypothetical protein
MTTALTPTASLDSVVVPTAFDNFLTTQIPAAFQALLNRAEWTLRATKRELVGTLHQGFTRDTTGTVDASRSPIVLSDCGADTCWDPYVGRWISVGNGAIWESRDGVTWSQTMSLGLYSITMSPNAICTDPAGGGAMIIVNAAAIMGVGYVRSTAFGTWNTYTFTTSPSVALGCAEVRYGGTSRTLFLDGTNLRYFTPPATAVSTIAMGATYTVMVTTRETVASGTAWVFRVSGGFVRYRRSIDGGLTWMTDASTGISATSVTSGWYDETADRWWLVVNGSTLYYSDGASLTWTLAGTPTTATFAYVAAYGDCLIAVDGIGTDSCVWTSMDRGATWSNRTPATWGNSTGASVAYGDSRFVAVDASSGAYYSRRA